uniref:Uncharacterized protein n=1 Tax=Mycena chlorophos TaxID=658473 RepID=A0ABQ0KV92_MYCCL|nr:predicted protein [Mycena chlorophos]
MTFTHPFASLPDALFAKSSSRLGILPLGGLLRSRGPTTTAIRHEHRLPQGPPLPDDAGESAMHHIHPFRFRSAEHHRPALTATRSVSFKATGNRPPPRRQVHRNGTQEPISTKFCLQTDTHTPNDKQLKTVSAGRDGRAGFAYRTNRAEAREALVVASRRGSCGFEDEKLGSQPRLATRRGGAGYRGCEGDNLRSQGWGRAGGGFGGGYGGLVDAGRGRDLGCWSAGVCGRRE